MKLIVICALLFASALAEERPIYEFPEWWTLRDFDPSPFMLNRMRSGRIIGGQEATPNQFPYQVGLRLFIVNSNNIGLCGGSLVSTTRVVTAAHCVDIVSGLETVIGAHFMNREEPNQQRRTVPLSGLTFHENYTPSNLANDVAIISLPSPVILNAFVQIVNLPSAIDMSNDFVGETAVASGWGRFSSAQTSSEFLRFVNVNVITNTACRIRFPGIIQDSTICTSGAGASGNVGACNGDSGGPLTVQRGDQSTLIGIASFVSGLGCESGLPTGFARATSFAAWFRARM